MLPKLRFTNNGLQKFPKWEKKKLKDISRVIGGGTPPTGIDSYWAGDIPWFTPTEVSKEKYVSKSNRTITELGLKKSSAQILPVGTVLLTTRATLGEMAICTVPVTTNQGFQSIVPGKEVLSEFIYYLQPLIKKHCYIKASGSTFLEISKPNLESFTTMIPSIEEQQKITDFFTLLDRRIELQKEKVEGWRIYKKGIIQKLFSRKLRFMDEDGEEFPEWEEKKVKDVFRVTRGNVLAVGKLKENGLYPVYSSQTKSKGLMGYYDEYLYEDAITWTTDGANAGNTNYRSGKFYCTNVCGVLISDAGYANYCISEMLNLITFRYVSYVGNPKLMNNVMGEIKLFMPSVREQNEISIFLSLIDKKIEAEVQKTELYHEQKKGFMQIMFI